MKMYVIHGPDSETLALEDYLYRKGFVILYDMDLPDPPNIEPKIEKRLAKQASGPQPQPSEEAASLPEVVETDSCAYPTGKQNFMLRFLPILAKADLIRLLTSHKYEAAIRRSGDMTYVVYGSRDNFNYFSVATNSLVPLLEQWGRGRASMIGRLRVIMATLSATQIPTVSHFVLGIGYREASQKLQWDWRNVKCQPLETGKS